MTRYILCLLLYDQVYMYATLQPGKYVCHLAYLHYLGREIVGDQDLGQRIDQIGQEDRGE